MPIKINLSWQYKRANPKRKKNNKIYYIYSKLNYFTKYYYSNNIMKQKLINSILKNDPKI